jgi:hypothetical protein
MIFIAALTTTRSKHGAGEYALARTRGPGFWHAGGISTASGA